ncbi:superinfection immunity protein [Acidithiobacillus sp. MC6.1]|nr:superinfection immunity protein [Acidithiobacillus sp. MC6.1]
MDCSLHISPCFVRGVGTTVVCALYLWPALRAWRQGERQQRKVLAVNLFLGWAIFGWWWAWDLARHPSVPDLFQRKGRVGGGACSAVC